MAQNRTSGVTVQKISTDEGFSSLRKTWNDTLARSVTDNYCLRWEWLWAWWEVYREKDDRLCILLVFREDQLIGIAPFYVTQKLWKGIFPVKRLMFLGTQGGSVTSEYMDVIYKAGEEETVLRKVFGYILNENLCDDLDLHNVEASSTTNLFLSDFAREAKLLHIEHDKLKCPYITLPDHFEDFLRSCSSSLRYKIRTGQKKLMRHFDVVYRKTSRVSELKTDFEELIRLHQCRWESRDLPGSFSAEKFSAFQRRIMQEMLENDHLDLRFLSVSGKNIAVLYNIKYKNKIYYYQSGLDAGFDKNLSPGLLLHAHGIEEAIKEALTEYDFLMQGNMDAYKQRWTKEYRYVGDLYLARPGIMKILMSLQNRARAYYSAMSRSKG